MAGPRFANPLRDRTPAGDKPPSGKARQTPPKSRKPSSTFTLTPAQIEEGANEMFAFASMAMLARGDYYCAAILSEGGQKAAGAYRKLAETNPAFKRAIERIVGAFQGAAGPGAAITYTLAIAVPIAQHHGTLPEDFPIAGWLRRVFDPVKAVDAVYGDGAAERMANGGTPT